MDPHTSTNITSTIEAKSIVILILTDIHLFFPENITHTNMGLNKFFRIFFIYFIAEVVNVYVNNICIGLKVYFPNVHSNISTGKDPVLITEEIFKQLKFFGG